MRRAWRLLIVFPYFIFSGVAAAQTVGSRIELELLANIPADAMVIRPRMLAAYCMLLAAATLGVLYWYRQRAFIAYWTACWVLLAATLLLVTPTFPATLLGRSRIGLMLLLLIASTSMVLQAGFAFPDEPFQSRAALRWGLPVGLACLAAPMVLPIDVALNLGGLAAVVIVGWGSVRYLHLGRTSRHLGVMLIGGALAVVATANIFALLLAGIPDRLIVTQVTVLNVVAAVFVALGMHLTVFEDMTDELRKTNADLEATHDIVKQLAITDPLTGCHNRRFFEEIERREMERLKRYNSRLAVVFVDVNRFKLLNDTRGHDIGDTVLRMLGILLRRHVRQLDYVIRWGGDEFVLLLACSLDEAQAKMIELKAAFARECHARDLPPYLGLSIGAATVPREAVALMDAIRTADLNMYKDKLLEREKAPT